jgi:hypothetical protein
MEPDWRKPLPEEIARPSYWPALLALAMTLALLGPVTSMIVTCAGVILGAVSLIGWAAENLNG